MTELRCYEDLFVRCILLGAVYWRLFIKYMKKNPKIVNSHSRTVFIEIHHLEISLLKLLTIFSLMEWFKIY